MAVCEVLAQCINKGTKVDTRQPVEERETEGQHQRTESEQERESESQQQGGTELTEVGNYRPA